MGPAKKREVSKRRRRRRGGDDTTERRATKAANPSRVHTSHLTSTFLPCGFEKPQYFARNYKDDEDDKGNGKQTGAANVIIGHSTDLRLTHNSPMSTDKCQSLDLTLLQSIKFFLFRSIAPSLLYQRHLVQPVLLLLFISLAS